MGFIGISPFIETEPTDDPPDHSLDMPPTDLEITTPLYHPPLVTQGIGINIGCILGNHLVVVQISLPNIDFHHLSLANHDFGNSMLEHVLHDMRHMLSSLTPIDMHHVSSPFTSLYALMHHAHRTILCQPEICDVRVGLNHRSMRVNNGMSISVRLRPGSYSPWVAMMLTSHSAGPSSIARMVGNDAHFLGRPPKWDSITNFIVSESCPDRPTLATS